LRPGQSGHFYVGGAKTYTSQSPTSMNVDEVTAMGQNTAFRDVLLAPSDYAPLSIHVGHDGYTHNNLPHIKEPGEGRAGAFCGFSGRGAKYIPTLAQSLVKTWIEKGAL
jgi:glycine/D-amino acid oxidase-like deaminating enzyme